VHCKEELTERVLELPVMVCTDDVEGGVTHLICKFLNIRVDLYFLIA